MPIPVIAVAAVSFLVGGGVFYALQESQKDKLKTLVSNLERQNEVLAQDLAKATNREVKQRKERLQLLLRYYQARATLMIKNPTVKPEHFARLAAVSRQLPVVCSRLLEDGNPRPEDDEFIRILQLAMNAKETGISPSRVELASLDAYLDREQNGAVVQVMQELLTEQFVQKQTLIKQLEGEQREKQLRRAQLEKILEWGADDGKNRAELSVVNGQLQQLPDELGRLQEAVGKIRLQLVVLTILNDPKLSTPHDGIVRDIIERQLKGRALSPQEEDQLRLYQVTYFHLAKQALAGRPTPIRLLELNEATTTQA